MKHLFGQECQIKASTLHAYVPHSSEDDERYHHDKQNDLGKRTGCSNTFSEAAKVCALMATKIMVPYIRNCAELGKVKQQTKPRCKMV